jgi:hypothetical protein
MKAFTAVGLLLRCFTYRLPFEFKMQFVHPMLKVAAIERTALDTEGSRRNQDFLRFPTTWSEP